MKEKLRKAAGPVFRAAVGFSFAYLLFRLGESMTPGHWMALGVSAVPGILVLTAFLWRTRWEQEQWRREQDRQRLERIEFLLERLALMVSERKP